MNRIAKIENIDGMKVWVNPTPKQVYQAIARFKDRYGRWLVGGGDFYVFDAYDKNHDEMADLLGIRYSPSDKGTGGFIGISRRGKKLQSSERGEHRFFNRWVMMGEDGECEYDLDRTNRAASITARRKRIKDKDLVDQDIVGRPKRRTDGKPPREDKEVRWWKRKKDPRRKREHAFDDINADPDIQCDPDMKLSSRIRRIACKIVAVRGGDVIEQGIGAFK